MGADQPTGLARLAAGQRKEQAVQFGADAEITRKYHTAKTYLPRI